MVDVSRSAPLSAVLGFNLGDDGLAALTAVSLAPLASGNHPYGFALYLTGRQRLERIVPKGFVVTHCFDAVGFLARYGLSRDRKLGVLIEQRERRTFVRVSGKDERAVLKLRDRLRRLEAKLSRPLPDRRRYRLWYHGHHGPDWTTKELPAAPFAEVAGNYPARTRCLLERLAELERPEGRGRLLLWHGAPGTGKTRAVEAIATSWYPWADFHYILDSELLFNTPEYLVSVVLEERGADKDRWRVIVAEDVDDYLRTGGDNQALARLLNLCDGVVGRDSNLLVLLTTNLRSDRVAPALTRPGRCLALVEFSSFSPSEANAWLGDQALGVTSEQTLAQLYERRSREPRIATVANDAALGLYL